jgi:hypothetical protein
MHVPDPDQWVDRRIGGHDRVDRALRPAHGAPSFVALIRRTVASSARATERHGR